MSERDDRLPMHQMLEHAREAVAIIEGRSRSELETDRVLRFALAYLVQTVGEAATRVSREGQARYPEIPWVKAIGTRHRMVHGYDRIDFDVLWDTISDDLPGLIAALERALSTTR